MSFEEKVIMLRKQREMNQKQLADASGLTKATISRIESGDIRELGADSLKRLARALRVTVDYLIDNVENMDVPDMVRTDSEVQVFLRGYGTLSASGRKELSNYLQFLAEQEKKQDGG